MVEPPPQAPRRVNLLVWFAAAAVLALASPVFLVRFILTREWLEARVLPSIEAAVGRDIGFERLRIGFRGLVLEKLVVSERPGFQRPDEPDFATLERLVLGVRWLPLLRGQVVLDSISLDNPVLVLHRSAEGVINIADSPLLEGRRTDASADEATPSAPEVDGQRKSRGEDAPAGKARKEARQEAREDTRPGEPSRRRTPAARSLRLEPGRIDVHNGRVVWLDALSSTAVARIELRHLYLAAKNVSASAPFEARASMNLGAGTDAAEPIEIAAQVDLPAAVVRLFVAADAIDGDAYAAAISMAREHERVRIAAASTDTGRGTTKGASRIPEIEAEVRVASLLAWGLPFEDARATLGYRDGIVDVTAWSARLGKGSVSGSASGDWQRGLPSYRAGIRLEDFPLGRLAKAVAGPGGRLFLPAANGAGHGLRLRGIGGLLDASASYAGRGRLRTRDWLVGNLPEGEAFELESAAIESGTVTLAPEGGVGVLFSDLRLEAEPCGRTAACTAKMDGNFVDGVHEPVHFSTRAKLVRSTSTLELDAELVRLDVDALATALGFDGAVAPASGADDASRAMEVASGATTAAAAGKPDAAFAGKPDAAFAGKPDAASAGKPNAAFAAKPLRVRGTVAAETARFVALEALPLRFDYDWSDTTFAVREASGGFAGGTFSASASLDRRSGKTEAKAKLDGADLEAALSPWWTSRWGDAEATVGVDARASFPWPGWSEGPDAQADWRENLEGGATVRIPRGSWRGGALLDALASEMSAPAFAGMELRDSGGRLVFAKGRVRSDRFTVGGPSARVVASGSVAWTGDLELLLRVGLAPSSSSASLLSLSEWTRGSDGWSSVPVEVRGSLGAPEARLPAGRLLGETLGAAPRTAVRAAGRGATTILQGIGEGIGSILGDSK